MRGLEFNHNWKFKETEERQALHMTSYDDSEWEVVSLPHDWSVLKSCDPEAEGCTAYFPGGLGWYRKSFVTTEEMVGQRVLVQFDGIYNRSDIYCNGTFLKFHPYGYSPCMIDVTEQLAAVGETNVIAVRVDHTRYADSRWYTGSGIYRKVSMHILPAVHVPVWGVAIATESVEGDVAKLQVSIDVCNTKMESCDGAVSYKVIDCNGTCVLAEKQGVMVEAEKQATLELSLEIVHPILWKILEGKQYTLQLELSVDDVVIQEKCEKFGIRTFCFDADKGFFFNGENTLIKGVCLHHDVSCVGAAVPLAVWRRRLEILIEGGTNAIRTAHNPFAEEFFELCDELGLLVQEEFYDEWDNPKDKKNNGQEKFVDYQTRGHAEYFREYAKEDLQNVVLRDRNRPCIIQWSIGNEIEWTYTKYNNATGYFGANASGNFFWTMPSNSKEEIHEIVEQIPREQYEIGDTAHKLSKWTKEIDISRPVTANCILPSVSYATGYTDALDLVGYSYRQIIYKYGHKHYPEKSIMGTENLGQWHEWKAVLDNEHVSGMFIWTGTDYLGEASKRGPFPIKGTKSGLLDLASFKKPSFYMFQGLWTEEPCVYIATQTVEQSLYKVNDAGLLYAEDPDEWKYRKWVWQDVNPHWNYGNHEMIAVEVYSNCEEVTLYVNDNPLATEYLADYEDHIYKWAVPYSKGTIKAIGKKDGQEVMYEIKTAGEIATVEISADFDRTTTSVDDAVHVTLQLCDANGIPVTHEEAEVEFHVEGAYKLLGIDNGRVDSVQDYQSTKIVTNHGQCLLIIQAAEVGELAVYATCKVNQSNIAVVSVK